MYAAAHTTGPAKGPLQHTQTISINLETSIVQIRKLNSNLPASSNPMTQL